MGEIFKNTLNNFVRDREDGLDNELNLDDKKMNFLDEESEPVDEEGSDFSHSESAPHPNSLPGYRSPAPIRSSQPRNIPQRPLPPPSNASEERSPPPAPQG